MHSLTQTSAAPEVANAANFSKAALFDDIYLPGEDRTVRHDDDDDEHAHDAL